MKINIIQTDRVLSQTSINIADYVINPYRGCEYGCLYCYSCNNKNMIHRKNDWGKFVDVKTNSIEVLRKELSCLKDKKYKVLLGSITEVFQPVEEQYQITESILKLLKEYDVPVIILTKSPLVEKQIDLLKYSKENKIYVTYNSPYIRKMFESKTPSYQKRLKVIRKLIANNIRVVVYISPFFPLISDYKGILCSLSELPDDKFQLYIEGYNLYMGNWEKLAARIPPEIRKKYHNIYKDNSTYNLYWDGLKSEIHEYNRQYGYDIKFFIYPFNEYYNNEIQ